MVAHFEIRVYGRVQGVGFRYSALTKARSLDLKGWVKNLPDGTVLTAVEGDPKECHSYIHWCREGSGYSWVEKVEVVEKEVEGLPAFRIV